MSSPVSVLDAGEADMVESGRVACGRRARCNGVWMDGGQAMDGWRELAGNMRGSTTRVSSRQQEEGARSQSRMREGGSWRLCMRAKQW